MRTLPLLFFADAWCQTTFTFAIIPNHAAFRSPFSNTIIPNHAASLSTLSNSVHGTLQRRRVSTLFAKARMQQYYSPEELDAIHQEADLVSIVESYQLDQFRRIGHNRATCICPFHDDNNPSLSIDANRGIYKCFACGAGGNAITFVREMSKVNGENLTFQEAVEITKNHTSERPAVLFSKATSRNSTSLRSESNHLSDRILLANLAALTFYEECLSSLPTAGIARSYLRERGITPKTSRSFGVGFAPDAYFSRGGVRAGCQFLRLDWSDLAYV